MKQFRRFAQIGSFEYYAVLRPYLGTKMLNLEVNFQKCSREKDKLCAVKIFNFGFPAKPTASLGQASAVNIFKLNSQILMFSPVRGNIKPSLAH